MSRPHILPNDSLSTKISSDEFGTQSSLLSYQAHRLRLGKRQNASNGQARGRAKSQLRKSGASQKLYRKKGYWWNEIEDKQSEFVCWDRLDCRHRLVSDSWYEDCVDDFCIVFDNNAKHKKHPKKVQFNLTPIVHLLSQWDEIYKAERWGYWEKIRLDRQRFLNRISRTDIIVGPVLVKEHRMRIWNERFSVHG